MVFRNPRALSSALAALGTLQPRALGFLNTIDPLDTVSNCYVDVHVHVHVHVYVYVRVCVIHVHVHICSMWWEGERGGREGGRGEGGGRGGREGGCRSVMAL